MITEHVRIAEAVHNEEDLNEANHDESGAEEVESEGRGWVVAQKGKLKNN